MNNNIEYNQNNQNIEKKNKKGKIVVFILSGLIFGLGILYFIGWPLLQRSVITRSCVNEYGPGYKSTRVRSGNHYCWKCLNVETKEIVELSTSQCFDEGVEKPIIYLYPERETEITVKLGKPESLTESYPKYIDGWNVIAKPSGKLLDTTNNRELYSLYYENKSNVEFGFEEGFIVEGKNAISFLEEKLAILGLSDTEVEEFIIYWAPRLEKNKYNLVRFATIDEISENMPLYLSKEPDSLIRVLMVYKSLDNKINIPEQKLITPLRTGFVVVEWGGVEIK